LEPDATVFEQRKWAVHTPQGPAAAAAILAVAEGGEVVSARFGPRTAGTTFHPEAAPDAVEEWFRNDPAVRARLTDGRDPQALARSLDAIPALSSTWKTVIPGFLTEVCSHERPCNASS